MQPTNALKATGADGRTVQQVLQQHGFDTSEAAISSTALRADQVDCLLWQPKMIV